MSGMVTMRLGNCERVS